MTTSQLKQDALFDEFLPGCTDPKLIFPSEICETPCQH